MEVQEPESVSLEELLAGLEIREVESEDGFLDVEGWARVWSIAQKEASKAICKLVKAGRMTAKKVQRANVLGAPYWKPVYGVIKRGEDRDQDQVQDHQTQSE